MARSCPALPRAADDDGCPLTIGEFLQRASRADFIDGLGIYIGPHEVALAYISKTFFKLAVREVRTYPLPPTERAAERRQALVQALLGFAGEHHIDPGRAYLCLPRSVAAFNRVLLPAAARENLAQVLEYELEHLLPLPREQVFYDYSSRSLGEDRVEVLLMSVPRALVQEYLDALAEAGVKPRGVVLASTAIADYLAFCRGETEKAVGILLGAEHAVEFALVAEGKLVASQVLPAARLQAEGALSRALARELAEELVEPEDLAVYRWDMNGVQPELPLWGEGNLPALATGKLAAPAEFFDGQDRALLPAVGAALEAVREGSLPVNLLPDESRAGSDSGFSIYTIGFGLATLILLVVWGFSAIIQDYRLENQVKAQLAELRPAVEHYETVQAEIDGAHKQLEILSPSNEQKITLLLKDLSDALPTNSYLTMLTFRAGGRLTIEGQATSVPEVMKAVESSPRFKSVSQNSQSTPVGDKVRFSLLAEIER